MCPSQLYATHYADVFSLAASILRDQCDAEEATHDVLLKACTLLQQGAVVESAGGLRRWLLAVARHRALDIHKRRRRAVARERGYAVAHEHWLGACGVEDAIDARGIVETLRSQHPEDLELIVRCLCLNHDRAGVARQLGISSNALNVRVHRALGRLREAAAVRLAGGSHDRDADREARH